MIKINEDFEFERDNHGWQLHQWRDGKSKDGSPKRQKKTTYHSNIDQVCAAFIDRSAGDCSSIEELRGMLLGTRKAVSDYFKMKAEAQGGG